MTNTTPLKQYRLKKKLSQRDFADLLEQKGQEVFGTSYLCDAPMVSRWELGKNVPAGHHLLTILLVVGGTIEPRQGKLSLMELVKPTSAS